MMTGSSFAWYTISTKGEMKQIKAELKATDNLEIAKADKRTATPNEVALNDAGNEYAWGSDVTSWGSIKMDVPAAATTSGATYVATVDYDEHGRVKDANILLTDAYSTKYDNGVTSFTTGTTKINGIDKLVGAVGYAAWLRSNDKLTDIKATVTGDDRLTDYIIRWQSFDATDKTKWNLYSDSKPIQMSKADMPVLVEVIVFIDGDEVHAEDVEAGLTDSDIQVVFHSDWLDSNLSNNNSANKASGYKK